MAHITVENLSFTFQGKKTPFFEQLSCTIPDTGITFLRGKNGVGKSTFLQSISGQASTGIVSGILHLPGAKIALANRALVRQQVALLTQEVTSALALSYSVRMNLLGAAVTQYPRLRFLPKKAAYEELLVSCGIAPESIVGQLSGGQRQLVALLSMVQKKRSLLVLDEPTAALDDENTQRIFKLILQLQAEHPFAVFCITHDDAVMQQFDNGASVILTEHGGKRKINLSSLS